MTTATSTITFDPHLLPSYAPLAAAIDAAVEDDYDEPPTHKWRPLRAAHHAEWAEQYRAGRVALFTGHHDGLPSVTLCYKGRTNRYWGRAVDVDDPHTDDFVQSLARDLVAKVDAEPPHEDHWLVDEAATQEA